MNLKPWMKWAIPIFFIFTLAFYVPTFFMDNNIIEVVGVTLITTFYHTSIRPFTGSIINAIYHNKMDYNKWWFRERKFEKPLYKLLQVKRWKNLFPTYDKKAFDFKYRNIDEILGATCQAEVVHEIMFLLSFLPLILITFYGTALVFILTSIVCALIEVIFILIQRYNRPRLIEYKKKQKLDR